MRYSKSSLLAIALTVACSAGEFSTVANAQNSSQDFPWRSKSSARAAASTVKSSLATPLATPTRDLTTSETIATPMPSLDTMPDVIYDEGKKYVRRGDTYIESPDVSGGSSTRENFATSVSDAVQTPAVKKPSLFQRTKDLTNRLNPFSKSLRSPTAYRSSDWKVPSFNKSLATFSKKDNDPITFPPVTPLPAKNSVPTSLDEEPLALASKDSYKAPAPAFASPNRDSEFKSALPTETKLTSVFASKKDVSSEDAFKPKVSTAAHLTGETKVPSSFSPVPKTSSKVSKASSKDFNPTASLVSKLPSTFNKAKLPKPFPAKTKIAADVSKMPKGFTHTQEIVTRFDPPTEMKSTSTFSAQPKARVAELNSDLVKLKTRMAESKPPTEIVKKVSQDFSPVAEVKTEIRREFTKARPKAVRPVRTAHALSVESEFWTPKR